MNSISILVVEDDLAVALEMEMIISKLGYKYMGNARSSVQAIKAMDKEKPDLIIMDIAIEGDIDGITLAESITSFNIPIIFITGIEDPNLFERAKKIPYSGYLVKPFHSLTLRSAIEKAIPISENSFNNLDDKKGLLLKSGNRFYKILLNEILFINVEGNYCYFFTKEKKFVLKLSMKRVLEKINDYKVFLKIHRNYVVHKKAITNFNSKDSTIFINGINIPVGRNYREQVMKVLKEVLN